MHQDKIILFGDSVLFGTGASHRNFGCGRILRSLLSDIEVVIKGRNDDTTYQGLERLNRDVLLRNGPAFVIILFGNNDCRLNASDKAIVSLTEYKDNLAKIISIIKSNNKVPIISNLQPIDSELFYKSLPHIKKFMINISSPRDWHEKYSCACEGIAKQTNIKLADIRSVLLEHGRDVISQDGLHPNNLGHKIIAEKFSEVLKEYFKND